MAKHQIWFAVAALALFLSSAVADDVVVLTEENFEKEVGQDKGALVEFYAPWWSVFLWFEIVEFVKSIDSKLCFYVRLLGLDPYVSVRNL